jgi:hypothetical protein
MRSAHRPASTTRIADAPGPALRAAYLRIREDYPDAPEELVEALMLQALDRTSDARIDAFRVVLAERETRSQLRRGCSLGDPAGAARLDTVGKSRP